MSTRAIFGIQHEDGTITGAWQWNDGDILTSFLNRNFNTLEKAKELIANGVWGTMFTEKEKTDFIECAEKEGWDISDTTFLPIGKLFLTKRAYYDNAPTVYKDYEDMAGQDINHTYIFNPTTNKWVKNKDLNGVTMKSLVAAWWKARQR